MQMRTGRPAGISAESDALTPLHLHALHHIYRLHVSISCLISEAVIYNDLISITEEFELDRLDHTVSGRIEPVAWLKCKVHSCMPLPAS